MWKLVQTGLSVVAGTAEPEYGPDSIRPVGFDLKEGEKCYREVTREDMKFRNPEGTNVETMVFYFEDSVYSGFAQIIHSSLAGLHVTAQFTFKVFKKADPKDFVWTSTHLEDFAIVNGTDFKAKDLSIVLSEDGKSYLINSSVNPRSEVIDLKLTLVGESVIFGKDGVTHYGTDPANPWGSMRHLFWPRCTASGKIICRKFRQPELDEQNAAGEYLEENSTDSKLKTSEEEYVLNAKEGLGMYVMALQGMKPHHAAASWDFLNYQSPEHSAVLMEFTTPPSYNRTTVSAAMVVDKNGKPVICTLNNTTEHLDTAKDEDCGWLVPHKMKYTMVNTLKDYGHKKAEEDDVKEVTDAVKAVKLKPTVKAVISGDLKSMSERVDVMAEIPQFVKNIVSGVAGTKPYIYQFSNELNLTVTVDGKETVNEKGYAYSETTFISE